MRLARPVSFPLFCTLVNRRDLRLAGAILFFDQLLVPSEQRVRDAILSRAFEVLLAQALPDVLLDSFKLELILTFLDHACGL